MNIRQVLRPNLQQQAAAAERRPQKKRSSAVVKRTDQASWSKQALEMINEQNRRAWEKPKKEENGNSYLKWLEKDLKAQEKCMKIFARIRNGDIVPPEDLNYLANVDSASFKLAMAQRKVNPHPKKWESVLDEEDRNGAAEDAQGDAGASGGEVAAAAGSSDTGSAGTGSTGTGSAGADA